jgi:peptidoglycan/LPS O-acetylase OafA/YrhL
MPAIAASVTLIVCLLERDHGVLARLLSSRPLRYVGRISYGLYLFNLLVRNLLVEFLPGHTTSFYAPVGFAITFAVAATSWHLLEARVLAGAARVTPVGRARAAHPRLVPAR